MKPVAILALLLSASALRADTAQGLFNRAVYSTCPTEQVELYTEALHKDPSLELGHHNLGAAYYRLCQFDKAIRVLDMALIADPTYPNTHYLLACCHARLGNMGTAMVHLKKATRYGWTEADMLASDTDLDGLRGPDFPRVRRGSAKRRTGHASSGRASKRKSRRNSKAAAAAAGAPAGAAAPADAGTTPPPPPTSGQPDDQPPAAPPQAGGKK